MKWSRVEAVVVGGGAGGREGAGGVGGGGGGGGGPGGGGGRSALSEVLRSPGVSPPHLTSRAAHSGVCLTM